MPADISKHVADYYTKHQQAIKNLHESFRKDIRERLIASGGDPADIKIGVDVCGYDTDVFIPSRNICVDITDEWEVCTQFHNENRYIIRDKMRTLTKAGMSALNVFHCEWKERRDQVMNMIASKCTAPKVRIAGRKTKFVILPAREATAFIYANHIQPVSNDQTWNYGLLYQDELVAVMTFFPYCFGKDVPVALSRFCCLPDVQVMGGADKLMQSAIKVNGWNALISWSDNRWSTGKLYERLGYKFVRENGPSLLFINTKGNIVQTMAADHSNIVVSRPAGMTVHERMLELGYVSYFEGGKKAWVWKSEGYKPYEPDALDAFMG